MPTKQVSPVVATEADHFEAALKAARIPDPLHDGMWDIWAASPARAHGLIARFMGTTIGQQVAAKLKQAMNSQAETRIEQALTQQRTKAGDELVATVQEALAALDPDVYQQIAAQIGSASSGSRATLTSSGKQSVVTKTAPMSPLEAAVKGLPITAVKDTPTTDPYAVALGADQARLERNKR